MALRIEFTFEEPLYEVSLRQFFLPAPAAGSDVWIIIGDDTDADVRGYGDAIKIRACSPELMEKLSALHNLTGLSRFRVHVVLEEVEEVAEAREGGEAARGEPGE